MEAEELIKRAWASVEGAGVPEALQELAFTEAIAALKASASGQRSGQHGDGASKGPSGKPKTGSTPPGDTGGDGSAPDDGTFFQKLQHESGLTDDQLRSVLAFDPAGQTIKVLPPTKDLGASKTAQAKSVLALVAGALRGGLGKSVIERDAVKTECERKNCYDMNNFANKVAGPMKGFNLNGTEIHVTAKWVDEFKTAVGAALGEDSK